MTQPSTHKESWEALINKFIIDTEGYANSFLGDESAEWVTLKLTALISSAVTAEAKRKDAEFVTDLARASTLFTDPLADEIFKELIAKYKKEGAL